MAGGLMPENTYGIPIGEFRTINIDINYVANDPDLGIIADLRDAVKIILGDTHGNALTLLIILIRSEILKCTLENFKILRQIIVDDLLTQDKMLNYDSYTKFLEILYQCEVRTGPGSPIFSSLGDNLADRVGNDAFTLAIFAFLYDKKYPVTICYSNHDHAFVKWLSYHKSCEFSPLMYSMGTLELVSSNLKLKRFLYNISDIIARVQDHINQDVEQMKKLELYDLKIKCPLDVLSDCENRAFGPRSGLNQEQQQDPSDEQKNNRLKILLQEYYIKQFNNQEYTELYTKRKEFIYKIISDHIIKYFSNTVLVDLSWAQIPNGPKFLMLGTHAAFHTLIMRSIADLVYRYSKNFVVADNARAQEKQYYLHEMNVKEFINLVRTANTSLRIILSGVTKCWANQMTGSYIQTLQNPRPMPNPGPVPNLDILQREYKNQPDIKKFDSAYERMGQMGGPKGINERALWFRIRTQGTFTRNPLEVLRHPSDIHRLKDRTEIISLHGHDMHENERLLDFSLDNIVGKFPEDLNPNPTVQQAISSLPPDQRKARRTLRIGILRRLQRS